MNVIAVTKQPDLLVKAIDKNIADKVLKTWKKMENNKSQTLYSHSPEQWDQKAMLKPEITNDGVSFGISWWTKNGEPPEEIKGYILGRFVEILMVHFKNYFAHLQVHK